MQGPPEVAGGIGDGPQLIREEGLPAIPRTAATWAVASSLENGGRWLGSIHQDLT
jgi:hypothetical protein